MDNPQQNPSAPRLVCPLCLGTDFTWGYLRGDRLKFAPTNTNTPAPNPMQVSSMPLPAMQTEMDFQNGMRAVACNRCKHILLFLER